MRTIRNLAYGYAFTLMLGAAVTGCELLDPDLWPRPPGGGGGGSSGGGGGGAGGDGKVCGGIAGLRCDARQFCDFPPGECSSIADGTGFCKALPEVCADIYAPVCGCDEKTYGNDCERQGAGVSKLHDGPCRRSPGAEGAVCGGLAGFPCAAGLFCEEEPGVCAIIADGTGICRPQPQACTKEYRPVCGCDGTTYGNDCTRKAAGVSKAHDGSC